MNEDGQRESECEALRTEPCPRCHMTRALTTVTTELRFTGSAGTSGGRKCSWRSNLITSPLISTSRHFKILQTFHASFHAHILLSHNNIYDLTDTPRRAAASSSGSNEFPAALVVTSSPCHLSTWPHAGVVPVDRPSVSASRSVIPLHVWTTGTDRNTLFWSQCQCCRSTAYDVS